MNGTKYLLFLFFIFQVIYAKAYVNDTVDKILERYINELYTISSSNTDSAMLIVDKAIELAAFSDKKDYKAELLRLKGLNYIYKVDFMNAFDFLNESIHLNKEIGNIAQEASALSNLTVVYSRKGLYDKALEIDLKVLEMRKQLGDSIRIAASLNNIAVAYMDKGDPDKALDYFNQAILMSQQIGEIEDLDLFYNNVGRILMNKHLYDSALVYFEKSERVAQKTGDKQIYQNALAYKGEYLMAKKQYNEACIILKKALDLSFEMGIVYEIQSTAEYLYQAYEALGNYENAHHYHKLFKLMSDSANSIEVVQAITTSEALADFEKERKTQKLIQEKKEMQARMELNYQKQVRNLAFILVLFVLVCLFFIYLNLRRKTKMNLRLVDQRNAIISQKEEIEAQRDEIEGLNKTKDKFFAIIAHDLRNPLGAVSQLSSIMYDDFEIIEKSKLKEYVGEVHKSVEKTYELLENLLSWSMVQTGSINISSDLFNLTSIVQDTVGLLAGLAKQKRIKIVFNECNECLAYADQMMINTVVRNILQNAIKFTPENGNIKIGIARADNFWQVSVQDSGLGIPDKLQKEIFSLQKDNDNSTHVKGKGTGLGLVICKEFVELNKGKIWVESVYNQGAMFKFTVPVLEA